MKPAKDPLPFIQLENYLFIALFITTIMLIHQKH